MDHDGCLHTFVLQMGENQSIQQPAYNYGSKSGPPILCHLRTYIYDETDDCKLYRQVWANIVDPDQIAPVERAV